MDKPTQPDSGPLELYEGNVIVESRVLVEMLVDVELVNVSLLLRSIVSLEMTM